MKPSMIRVRHVLALGLLASSLLVACSKQEEGERCSTENDDNDCEGSLICVAASDLRGEEVSRCCPPEGSPVSDGRCTRLIGGGSGGSGGGGNQGGEGGEASTATAASTTVGASCAYDSECPEGLVCGPGGVCQTECRVDRDCEAPLVCSEQGSCVAADNGSAGGSF